MDPEVIGYIGLAILLLLLGMRVPIAIALSAVGLFGLAFLKIYRVGFEPDLMRGLTAAFSAMGTSPYSTVAQFQLVAIPMFLLMGYFMYAAEFTKDMYYSARLWLSSVPGGLAAASTIGCAAFAAVSGSSVATAAAMGKIAVPEMLRFGYSKSLATGVVAASGTLGSLIPPSTLMILYAIFTDQDIGKLFIAGIIPGLLSAGVFVLGTILACSFFPKLAPRAPKVAFREKVKSLKGVWGMVALFVTVLVGIYGGIVTPTEAGAIGAAGAFILGVFSRRLSINGIRNGLYDTIKQVAVIFVIIIGAFLMIKFVALSGISASMANAAISLDLPPVTIVFALSVVYVFLGMFLGPLEIMLLTVPVVTPVIESLGFDLIWFGIIMIKYLEIGLITPPVGLTVYVINSVVGNDVELATIFKGALFFVVMDVITLILLIVFPEISLFLPSHM